MTYDDHERGAVRAAYLSAARRCAYFAEGVQRLRVEPDLRETQRRTVAAISWACRVFYSLAAGETDDLADDAAARAQAVLEVAECAYVVGPRS